MVHNISQDNDLCVEESDENDNSFDVVRVKYINSDSVKFIIFTNSYDKMAL